MNWAEKMRQAKEANGNQPIKIAAEPAERVEFLQIIQEPAPEYEDLGAQSKGKLEEISLFELPASSKGTVVLDTNAFIKGFDNFLATADVFVTTAAVIQECKDRKTRDFLERLPVPIEVLEPTVDSVKKIIAVAERTGDIGMLSKTDLHLCALAYDIGRQKRALGAEITPGSAPITSNDEIEVTDSDDEEEEEEEYEETSSDDGDGDWLNDVDSSDDEEEAEDEKTAEGAEKKKEKKKSDKKKNKKKEDNKPAASEKKKSTGSGLPGWGDFEDDWGTPDDSSKKPGELSKKQQKKLAKQQAEAAKGAEQKTDAPAATAAVATETAAVEKKQVTIKTPEQKPTQVEELAKARHAHAYSGGFSAVTSDFPMQNVLLHCGVPTVGSNGQCIRELRVWVLRCHACAAIVHDTLRQFCPECGSGDTLKRVHYVMNDRGEKHLFVNFKHRISTRGTIFNLSKPRGGRKGTNKTLVLREDQLRGAGKVDARERFMRERRNNYDGLGGGDELAGFGERDGKAGRRDGNFMMERSSYTRKNVNEARKVRASRKR